MFQNWKKIVCRPLKILDILIALLVLGTTLFLICYRNHIPEKVPYHWDFAGKIDDYGDAGSYLMLLILMYFFWAGHTLTKLFSVFDIKENLLGKRKAALVTKETEVKAYNLLFAMLWICDFLIQSMFAYIILCGVLVKDLGVLFLPASLGLLMADFVWFFVRLRRLQKFPAENVNVD